MPTEKVTPRAALRQLVEQHDIRYEVWPHRIALGDGALRVVGYDLDLTGIHHDPGRVPQPGCPECVRVHRVLCDVARAILPRDQRESYYEVSLFDQSLHHAPKRGLRPEVRAVISVRHRSNHAAPADPCEVRCVRDMITALEEFGAREG